MRKRDELTDPNSCMSRAKDDEWTFVLLGRDPAAPAAIRTWIEERIRLGKNKPGDAQLVEAAAWIAAVMSAQHPLNPLDKPLADNDTCPRCLGELDTGWECNDCGFDARPAVFPNCNVCGVKLRTRDEDEMGMCEKCAAE